MTVSHVKWTALISLILVPAFTDAAPKNAPSKRPPVRESSPSSHNPVPNAPVSLGVHGGMGLASNATANAAFGLMGEYRVQPDIGVGFYLSNLLAGGATTPFGTTTGNLAILAAEANYHFPTELAPVLYGGYAGIKAGVAINFFSSSIPGLQNSTSAGFVVGPAVGYDYGLSEKISVGGQLNDLIITNSSSGGVLNVFNILVIAKYFFI